MSSEKLLDNNTADKSIKLSLKKCDDFPSLGIDLFKKINFKIAIFLFVISFLVNSDIFIEKILIKFKDAVSGELPTSHGVIIQIMVIIISYIIIDLLVQSDVI
jgi:hypothetical protein